ECVRADLDRARARARPAVAPRIQTARRLSAPRGVRALHASADHLERATRLGHDGPLGVARRPRRNGRLASHRSARISRRAFFLFLAAALSRNRLGGYRELAAGPATIQGAVSG